MSNPVLSPFKTIRIGIYPRSACVEIFFLAGVKKKYIFFIKKISLEIFMVSDLE